MRRKFVLGMRNSRSNQSRRILGAASSKSDKGQIFEAAVIPEIDDCCKIPIPLSESQHRRKGCVKPDLHNESLESGDLI